MECDGASVGKAGEMKLMRFRQGCIQNTAETQYFEVEFLENFIIAIISDYSMSVMTINSRVCVSCK